MSIRVMPATPPVAASSPLDLEAVRAAPGVIAVLTAKDIPGVNDCSPSVGGDPILADGQIAYHGQLVFAVVAETREAARRASLLARIEIAAETPAVTVEDAVASKTRDVGEPYAFARRDVKLALRNAASTLDESPSASAARSISISKARSASRFPKSMAP